VWRLFFLCTFPLHLKKTYNKDKNWHVETTSKLTALRSVFEKVKERGRGVVVAAAVVVVAVFVVGIVVVMVVVVVRWWW